MTTTFDHQGIAVVLAILDISVEIFEHLGITSWKAMGDRVSYTCNIPKGLFHKKYPSVIYS